MTILKATLIGLALAATSTAAALAHDLSGVDRTQAGQLREIELQRQRGQLTRREYNALVAEQGRIAGLEQSAKSDGIVTGREYRVLREAQRDAANHIYQDSHNGRVNYLRQWKWNHGWRY